MGGGLKDDLDRKLVARLQADARESVTTLAAELGVARSTIHERLKRLESDGTIAGYSVVLNEEPGVERVQALVMASVRQQKNRDVIATLKSFPEIKTCYAINGEFDMFLMIETPRLEDLDTLLDEIAEIPGVERSRSSIVLSRKFRRGSA